MNSSASRGRLDNTCCVGALGFPVADSWFSARQVADGITLVTEPHVDSLIRPNFYHVHGSEADLIVDKGTGSRRWPGCLAGSQTAPSG